MLAIRRRRMNRIKRKMDKATKTFRTVARVPSLASAQVLREPSTDEEVGPIRDNLLVSSLWSQICHESNKTIWYRMQHIVNPTTRQVSSLMPQDCSSELSSKFSPTGKYRAVLKDVPPSANSQTKKQFMEIWGKSNRISATDLEALDVHGDVYFDVEFKSFDWSPKEDSILYIAETKIPKSEPFYKRSAQDSASKASSGDKKPKKGEEYLYKEDWGEQMVGKHRPALAVFNVQSENGQIVSMLEGIPDNFSPAQALWAPDGSIVGIVWDHEPRRLGLYACTNRSSYVFHLAEGTFKLLTSEGLSVRSPRFSPDGKYLLWLERKVGGPHNGAQRLIKYEWATGKSGVVLDIIADKLDGVDPLKFRGIFCSAIPTRSWSKDNRRLLMNTMGPTTITSFVINIESGKVTVLNSSTDYSLSVLDVYDDYVLCAKSSPKHPKTLVFAKLPEEGNEKNIDWVYLTEYEVLPGLEKLEYGVHYTQASYDDGFKDLNAIYLKPDVSDGSTLPVIIWPHGGPHGNFVNAFNNDAAVFSLLGFGVIMVNYRGSTGMGEDCVNYLLGKIGDADVKDCQQIAEELCSMETLKFDSKRKVLFGGSHGGFLSAHLIGQYPESFRCAVLLNPVTDVMSMSSVTDIPDWVPTKPRVYAILLSMWYL
ncbi:acylamino-acid-releasing enzyme isoform X2 [Nilaparvata lugens]|uniref:acylamino-acid-releasing enzyme isoform X2 n=1 Tax=Nilaparvata lugens TaxID=108931 RepID=UPI00193D0795|nr:acylamino-acid-releasing enzyme isoform X2 [Nilaparvata lugens]